MQNTLFDLPEEIAPRPVRKDLHRYFLWKLIDGKEQALMCSHDNGGAEFCPLDELTRQPHLYNSYQGAQQARRYQESVHGESGLYITRWDATMKGKR